MKSLRIPFMIAITMAAVFSHGQAKPVTRKTAAAVRPAGVTVYNMSASPSSISFTSTDPDLGTVAGSAAATVTFSMFFGTASNTWTLSVSSASSTFTGGSCTTIPASAITATCSSVSDSSFGGTAATGACGAAAKLSTTGKTIVSGSEGTIFDTLTVTVNFTLSDSWAYIAATSPTCPLSITYTLNAP
jgi:hypothetical protein